MFDRNYYYHPYSPHIFLYDLNNSARRLPPRTFFGRNHIPLHEPYFFRTQPFHIDPSGFFHHNGDTVPFLFDNPLHSVYMKERGPYPLFPQFHPPLIPAPYQRPRLIDAFKTKEGYLDINKMIKTAGQLIGTVNQLAGTMKNLSSLFKT